MSMVGMPDGGFVAGGLIPASGAAMVGGSPRPGSGGRSVLTSADLPGGAGTITGSFTFGPGTMTGTSTVLPGAGGAIGSAAFPGAGTSGTVRSTAAGAAIVG